MAVVSIKELKCSLQSGWLYSRWINPTIDAASQTLNSLEGGHGTPLFSSGMTAISTALFVTLKSGDRVEIIFQLEIKSYLKKLNVNIATVAERNVAGRLIWYKRFYSVYM